VEDDRISFNPAAFKHGLTVADIYRAFETYIFEEPMAGEVNKHLLIGFDTHGNHIEVMYNRIDLDTVNVFHAMPCRKATLANMQ
jgi:hypothetical protein